MKEKLAPRDQRHERMVKVREQRIEKARKATPKAVAAFERKARAEREQRVMGMTKAGKVSVVITDTRVAIEVS